jgi:DNA-binding CsgD family transcriptional regulator
MITVLELVFGRLAATGGERSAREMLLRGIRALGLQPVVLYEARSDSEIVVIDLANERSAAPPTPTGWDRLTEREQAVARLAGKALTNQQIARRLGISAHTVNFHLRQIFRKLEIGSRVSLAVYAEFTENL